MHRKGWILPITCIRHPSKNVKAWIIGRTRRQTMDFCGRIDVAIEGLTQTGRGTMVTKKEYSGACVRVEVYS